jgi:gluconokinase
VQAAVNRNEPIIASPLAIVVMGVSGSGKSTVGPLLAARLGCSFIEGDELHDPAAIAMMRSGRPLTDTERWPWLDRIGAAMARDIAARGIAVAACSALKRSYRDRLAAALKTRPHFVLLDSDPDELLRRLTNRPGHYMPPALLESQLATLERPADDETALTLDTHAAPEALVDDAVAWLAGADARSTLQESLR